MRLKKIFLTALASLLVMGQTIPALAADTVITLDSSARNFVKVENDLDFQDMEPGEEREARITLSNSSKKEMSFYLSGEIIYNIADQANDDQWAIYDLKLFKGNEEEPFFDGTIGSEENKKLENSSTGLNYLKDDTLLVTLKKGESATVRMNLKLDGDSTENAYMNKAGEIKLNIYASVPTENDPGTVTRTEKKTIKKQNVIQKIIQVKTGDGTRIGLIALVGGAALVLIIILLIVKSKCSRKGE